MRDQVEAEKLRRDAWQERRRSARAGWDAAIDALYVQLFGDPRNRDDLGAIGDNTARINGLRDELLGKIADHHLELDRRMARLERMAGWIAAAVVSSLLVLIADLVVRIVHP